MLLSAGVAGLGTALIVAVAVYWEQSTVEHAHQSERAIASLRNQLDAVRLHGTLRGEVYALVTARSDEGVKRIAQRVRAFDRDLDVTLRQVEVESARDRTMRKSARRMVDALDQFRSIAVSMSAAAASDRLASISMLGDFLAAYDASADTIDELTGAIERWVDWSRARSEQLTRRAQWGIGLTLVVTAIAVVVLLLGLSRRFQLSLRALRDQLEAIRGGDLTRRSAAPFPDELGELAGAVDTMAGGLDEMVSSARSAAAISSTTALRLLEQSSTVREISNETGSLSQDLRGSLESAQQQIDVLATTARELLEAADEASNSQREQNQNNLDFLRGSATELRENVMSTAQAIEELASTSVHARDLARSLAAISGETLEQIGSVAASAEQARKAAHASAELTGAALKAATTGSDQILSATEGLERIRAAEDEARVSMDALNSSASEISVFLDIMDAISSETNLLALNASIVAAQTDDGGAFRVVADQIRTLADRARGGTATIREVVARVSSDAATGAEVVTRNGLLVATELRGFSETRQNLAAIIRSAEESSGHSQQISQSAEEQAAICDVASDAMQQLRSTAIQVECATDEQSCGAAQLRTQADGLESIAQAVSEAANGHAAAVGQIANVGNRIRSVGSQIETTIEAQRKAADVLSGNTDALETSAARTRDAAAALDEDASELVGQGDRLKRSIECLNVKPDAVDRPGEDDRSRANQLAPDTESTAAPEG